MQTDVLTQYTVRLHRNSEFHLFYYLFKSDFKDTKQSKIRQKTKTLQTPS